MARKTDLPIETERLQLRGFQKSDLDAMMSYHALPEVQRYLDMKARDRAEVKAALDTMVKQNRLTRPGDAIHFAVTRKADGILIGQASLRWTDATASQAELRFVFSPFHRKQGYATEAVSAAIDYGFSNFGFHRIFARCAGSTSRRSGCSTASACGSRRTIASMPCSKASGTRSCISRCSIANGAGAARSKSFPAAPKS